MSDVASHMENINGIRGTRTEEAALQRVDVDANVRGSDGPDGALRAMRTVVL